MAIGLLYFLYAAFTAQYIVIPEYIVHLGGEEWQLGIVISSFAILPLLFRPFMGRWTAAVGPRKAGMVAGLLFTAAILLHVPIASIWLLIPVRMLNGAAMALAIIAGFLAVANLAPESRRGEGMAFANIAVNAGGIWTPYLGYYLLDSISFAWAFIAFAAMSFAMALCAAGISTARAATPPPNDPESTDDVPLISRPALFPTFILLTHTVTLAPLITFLPSFAEERELGNPALFWTMYSVVSMGAMLFSGPMADRLGRGSVVIPGLVLSMAAMFMLFAGETQPVFLAAAAVYGAGFGMLQPGLQAFMIDRVPPRERSAAMATNHYAWDIGQSGGALALGPIAGLWGVASTFAIVGAINAGGLVTFVTNFVLSSNPVLDKESEESSS